jgi:uncharacterized protein YndB with AHSA1/START domain
MTRRAAPATLNVMTTKSLLLTEFGGSVSADVDAPADDVFALLTDISRLPEWNARIRRVLEPAPAPLAPGVEWVVQMQMAGARWPSRSTAVTHDPGRRLFEHTSRSDDGNPLTADGGGPMIPSQRMRQAGLSICLTNRVHAILNGPLLRPGSCVPVL